MQKQRNMPIKVRPYQHQIDAFIFVLTMFGMIGDGGDAYEHFQK